MSHPAIGLAGKLLGNLAALAARTDAAERQIQQAAKSRLSSAQTEIEALRPRALLDPVADEHYQALVTETGHLRRVLASAGRNLGQS